MVAGNHCGDCCEGFCLNCVALPDKDYKTGIQFMEKQSEVVRNSYRIAFVMEVKIKGKFFLYPCLEILLGNKATLTLLCMSTLQVFYGDLRLERHRRGQRESISKKITFCWMKFSLFRK